MSETLLKYLNRQLASEYEALANYMYFAAGEQDGEVVAMLLDFAREELDHAAMLLRLIREQGGEPVAPEFKYRHYTSLLSAVVMSAAEEDSAVRMYEMIRQILTDPQEQAMIDLTIQQEKEHSRMQQAMAKRLRARKQTA